MPQKIIKTKRLILTPLDIKDADRYVEIAEHMRREKKENPDYFLYVRFDDSVKNLKQAATELLTSAEKSVFPEVAKRMNICLKNGKIIGYVGFLYHAENEKNSDLGIFLDPEYEHQGYALEAQVGLLADYFINYGDRIYLTIHPKNVPSARLNTKCGAVKTGHVNASKYGSERDIYVITRGDFIKAVFGKIYKTAVQEKQFLTDYVKNQ